MESLFPPPEHQERATRFADAVLALKPKVTDLGLILENVIQESDVLNDLAEGVADKDAMVDMPDEERAGFKEFSAELDRQIDEADAAMTEEGRDEVRVIIDDPQLRDDVLQRVLANMIEPLASQFSGRRVGDSITDARSTRSRITEILTRVGVRGKSKGEIVRRLTATFRFSG